VAEIRWDIKRGAGIYSAVLDGRLKNWISTGKIKSGEVVVWRSSFSGWRKPEELKELEPFFKRWEKSQLRIIGRKKLTRREVPPKKKIKNILVIDDEKDICLLLHDILTHSGYNVTTANTKKEGLSCIKKQPPHLIFLDLKLPDGDGMKILSKVKEISPKTMVNIISAYGAEERKEEAKKRGVYAFIDKPFTEETILRSIKKKNKIMSTKQSPKD